MKIGIMGLGVVGGALEKWLKQNTHHEVIGFDPPRKIENDLTGCQHIFISVPVPSSGEGQDLTILKWCVQYAKKFTQNIFIRSTVLPGTNDTLNTFSMPEFLTERKAFEDFSKHPVIIGGGDDAPDMELIFPTKEIIYLKNIEAEITKFTHNCFGAMKVTYFNIIEELCRKLSADYNKVLSTSFITGFIEKMHTQVPGPDGKRGYGGKCFPENIDAFSRYLGIKDLNMQTAQNFFHSIDELNNKHRGLDNSEVLEMNL